MRPSFSIMRFLMCGFYVDKILRIRHNRADSMPKSFILIIDDDPEVATMLASYLEAVGYQAEYVLDGAQAAARMRERRPSLILMDFRMPGGSGSEVYGRLQNSTQTAGVPIIFMSGLPLEEVRAALPEAPNVRFIKKPVDVKILRRWIDEFLKSEPTGV